MTRSPSSCARASRRSKRGEVAEERVDVAVVADVVAVVGLRRALERGQPDGVHTQRRDVRQPRSDAVEVADPVAVGVGEGARVDLVDDRVPPPLRFAVHGPHSGVLAPPIRYDGATPAYIRCTISPSRAWIRLWQWSDQIPGLSATNATS